MWSVFPANHLTVELTKQTYSNSDQKQHHLVGNWLGACLRHISAASCTNRSSLEKLYINENYSTRKHHGLWQIYTDTRLKALFPGLPRWAGTREVKNNLDFTEARDSEWQWHQLGHKQVCNSLQKDNHASTPPLSFLQAGCPSCRPNNSIKARKAKAYGKYLWQKLKSDFHRWDVLLVLSKQYYNQSQVRGHKFQS